MLERFTKNIYFIKQIIFCNGDVIWQPVGPIITEPQPCFREVAFLQVF